MHRKDVLYARQLRLDSRCAHVACEAVAANVCRPPQMPTKPVRKPAGSRVQVSSTSGKLDIDIPPEGLSGSNIGTGLFALAWNGFVAFWTVSMLVREASNLYTAC